MTGFAIVEWTNMRGGITAYIQTLEVAPEARGQGIVR
jgi:ribosomal protein S18 acetylase RimI-like enzyme